MSPLSQPPLRLYEVSWLHFVSSSRTPHFSCNKEFHGNINQIICDGLVLVCHLTCTNFPLLPTSTSTSFNRKLTDFCMTFLDHYPINPTTTILPALLSTELYNIPKPYTPTFTNQPLSIHKSVSKWFQPQA